MSNIRKTAPAFTLAIAGILIACSAGSANDPLAPDASRSAAGGGGAGAATASGANVRLRCELRSGRSRISADGRDLRPANGVYSARVTAAGGSATSGAQQAVLGEAEFDFDSDRGDIAAGATAIAPDFIAARPGPDVIAEILDAQGVVVASGGAECELR